MDYINFLRTRLINVETIDEDDVINSGLIQTLAECIYFIYGGKVCFFLMQTQKYNNQLFFYF